MDTTRSEGRIEILEKSVSVLQEDLGSVHVRLDNITALLEQLLIIKQRIPATLTAVLLLPHTRSKTPPNMRKTMT